MIVPKIWCICLCSLLLWSTMTEPHWNAFTIAQISIKSTFKSDGLILFMLTRIHKERFYSGVDQFFILNLCMMIKLFSIKKKFLNCWAELCRIDFFTVWYLISNGKNDFLGVLVPKNKLYWGCMQYCYKLMW